MQLSFEVQAALMRLASRHDVSPSQVRLLGILRDRELGMRELARHLELQKSSATGLVDRAQRRGLVRRSGAADDGRAVRVALTAKGRRLATAAAGELEAELAGAS